MSDECAATLSSVTHRYGDVVALDGLDLEIRSGEVLAVLGPNGAGKTTAVGLLLGSLQVQGGKVRVLGCDPGARGVRMRCGAMLQVSDSRSRTTGVAVLSVRVPVWPACANGSSGSGARWRSKWCAASP